MKQLHIGQLLLWSYLIWYSVIAMLYFDSHIHIWISAFGIAIIVGIALVLSTCQWPIKLKSLCNWQTMRLFIIPFCVSSYSSLIKGKGFILIFPPDIKSNSIAMLVIMGFLLFVAVTKKLGADDEAG